nr:cation:proton antiporter [Spirochaetota bacterium]
LFMVLFCSYLAHLAGLEPIIGAFLAGFIFNSLIPQKSVLMNRIDFIGNSIFIPIFLISVGMLVDVKMLFSDSKTWIVSGCMITVALISKLAAALITKRILKWGKYEAGLSYGLSVNQAAATLASVLVGYSLKFFDDSILTGTIMMITVTCFVGPIITDFFAKKIVLSQENGDLDSVKTNLRIMTPINNRNNVKELMELAFILHKKYSTDAIYPTNIVMDSFEVERELLNAEKIVSHAVAESVAVNVNVTPITRVDLNISSGILKAVRDLRITCIITGWNGNKSSIGKIFGCTIDPIIEGSTQIMIVNKIVRSFRTCERIILLIPPLVEKQTGFQELFEIIKNISEQLQTAITIVANEDTVRNAQNAMQKTKMTLLTGIIRLKNWKDITQTLDNIIKETDLVALFSARITRPAWQPILNKLPGIISKKYPKNNIMTLFPAEEKWLDNFEDKKKNKDDLYKILKKENIFFNLEKFKIQEAMKHMLSKKFGSQHETLSFLTSTLTNIFHNEPVQLLDDVVLVHAHISHIEDYVVYIGVNKNGFEIQNLSSKVKILIILLNSTENNAEYHLNLLKEIVSMVKNDIFINSLKDATSLKDFEKRMKS